MNLDGLLKFVNRAERLESLPRMGWVVAGVSSPESVAAHVHGTTLIALWLADSLSADAERVMRIALMHDLPESLITDLPKPVKVAIGATALADAELAAARTVLNDAPLEWIEMYGEYAEGRSLEARIVKAADRIQMVCKACQYEAQRRGDVQRFFDIPDQDYGIPEVAELLSLIRAKRESGWFASDLD